MIATALDAACLDDPHEHARRVTLLDLPHARALARYAARLRLDRAAHVPDIDPLDGGMTARVLLLLETPGPAIRRTGFVSRDNPTPTARNIRRFTQEAGLARTDTVIWNTVPWTIHDVAARNRAPRSAEIRDGIAALPHFLALLPHLRCVVLAGHVARRARAHIAPGVPVVEIPHPSPTIVCTAPAIAVRIRQGLCAAAAHV